MIIHSVIYSIDSIDLIRHVTILISKLFKKVYDLQKKIVLIKQLTFLLSITEVVPIHSSSDKNWNQTPN